MAILDSAARVSIAVSRNTLLRNPGAVDREFSALTKCDIEPHNTYKMEIDVVTDDKLCTW